MEDELSRKLDRLLNSPDGMEQLKQVMKALGVSTESGESPAAPKPTESAEPADSTLSGLLRLAPLLTSLEQDDQNTALLKALRPYLHNGREKRLDDSLKLLQLLKLLPLLQGGMFREF